MLDPAQCHPASPWDRRGGSAEGPRSMLVGTAERRARGAGVLPCHNRQPAFLQLQTSALTQNILFSSPRGTSWRRGQESVRDVPALVCAAEPASEGMLTKAAGFCRIRREGAAACVSRVLGRGGAGRPPTSSPPFPGLLSKVQNLPLRMFKERGSCFVRAQD